METTGQTIRISRETAKNIAQKELPQIEKEHMWIFPAFYYRAGIPVYRVKAYKDLTVYDLIMDSTNGKILCRTESCP